MIGHVKLLFPYSANKNISYSVLADSLFLRELPLAHRWIIRPNFISYFLGELRHMMGLPMRFSALPSSVFLIIADTTEKKMIRINAAPIIASVAYLLSGRNRPLEKHVRKPMRSDARSTVVSYSTVSGRVYMALPLPAAIRIGLNHICPERMFPRIVSKSLDWLFHTVLRSPLDTYTYGLVYHMESTGAN